MHYKTRRLISISILPLALAFITNKVLAKDTLPGRLVFLGKTADLSKSVWLSVTSAGSFEIQAQGQQVVDQFDKSKRGLHVTLSPFVSNGGGEPHSLFEISGNKPILIDKQNQQGGFIFPPFNQLPPLLRPPSGHMPTLPGGIRPPTGTIPPSGIMPSMPGGVRPPTANLSPGGITPSVPGGVRPPTANLAPGGITPSVPGGVRPPTANLSPGGITPSVPGGVRPPTANLAPGGITPSVPGGVRPPTANLSPDGITPSVPNSVTPPIASLPPGSLNPGETIPTAPPTINGNTQETSNNIASNESSFSSLDDQAPITQGRQFEPETRWNIWGDSHYYNIEDNRFDLDLKGTATDVTFGGDRRISNKLVTGVMLSLRDNWTSSFNDNMKSNSKGFTAGPYLGYQLSSAWALNASITYGILQNSNDILILKSNYLSQLYSASLSAIGQYTFGKVRIRPKPSVSLTHFRNNAYDMKGILLGKSFEIPMASDNFNYGLAQAAVEINRDFVFENKALIQPYTEVGLNYEFARPNKGQMVTGDLTLAATPPQLGTVTLGARTLTSKSLFIEISASYQSIGQSDLNLWQGRLYLSYAFN